MHKYIYIRDNIIFLIHIYYKKCNFKILSGNKELKTYKKIESNPFKSDKIRISQIFILLNKIAYFAIPALYIYLNLQ